MEILKNLKYSKTHEWIRVEDGIAYVGITDFAQHSLGDIVYVELPEVDTEVSKGDEISNIESVKAASPIFSPVSGTIIKVNEDLEDDAELINHKPYDAFIYAVELSDPSELDELMDADQYEEFCETEGTH
ncbi:MAG TPA: glycine cleavage system protein GcvH [Exilispira sp.]|nr:glycine cleavage system protein GcvH [Exilispira sp.]